MHTTDKRQRRTEYRLRIPPGIRPLPGARRLIIPVFIPHSGCPHRCLFCNQSAITGNPTSLPDNDRLTATIHRFLGHSAPDRRPREIAFFGGNFLGLPCREVDRMLRIAAAFVDSGAVDGIRFSTRPDTVTGRTLAWIRPFPIRTVEIGAQSMVDRVLTAAGRGHTAEDTRTAVARLRQEKLAVGLQLMTGLPGERDSDAGDSADRIAALMPDAVRIYPTLVVDGSVLARHYRNGDYRPQSLPDAVAQVKRLFRRFSRAGIPVIRMGLQAGSDAPLADRVLAGPMHPAFGHLVFCELMWDWLETALGRVPVFGARLELRAHPRNVARIAGHRRANRKRLEKRFRPARLELLSDDSLSPDTVVCRIGSE